MENDPDIYKTFLTNYDLSQRYNIEKLKKRLVDLQVQYIFVKYSKLFLCK